MNQLTQDKVLKALDSISQNAHMLTGAFIVFYPISIGHIDWLKVVIPSYVGLVAFKEFYWDNKHEIPEIRGSSLKDAIYYNVGWVGALILYGLSNLINKIW